MITFDTYEAVHNIVTSGLSEEQARRIVQTILNAKEYDLSKVATKEQVAELAHSTKEQVAELAHKIDGIEQRLETFATKEQLFQLGEKMLQMEIILRDEISTSKNDTIKWMVGLFMLGIASMFGKSYFFDKPSVPNKEVVYIPGE